MKPSTLRMPHPRLFTLLGIMLIAARECSAAPTTAPSPTIAIAPAVEDNQKVLHALVTIDGKPIKNVKIKFEVRRTFGLLPLGEDATDDEGTAAVPFPKDLPGNDKGEFQVVASIVSPESYAGVSSAQLIPGGIAIKPPTSPTFPRALWGARAPWPLAVTVIVLIGAVWLTYVRVISLVLTIRKAGRS